MQDPRLLVATLFVVVTGLPALVWAVHWTLLRADRGGDGGGRSTPPRPNRPIH